MGPTKLTEPGRALATRQVMNFAKARPPAVTGTGECGGCRLLWCFTGTTKLMSDLWRNIHGFGFLAFSSSIKGIVDLVA